MLPETWMKMRPTQSWRSVAITCGLCVCLVLAACMRHLDAKSGFYAACTNSANLPALGYEVVRTLPHDPAAYTQGLLLHEGVFFESTGLYGQSSLRRLEQETGLIQAQVELPPQLFGEGLALAQGKLYQLTWREGEVRTYRPEDLQLLESRRLEGEGWGLAYDGSSLIQTDGSASLIFRQPEDLAEQRRQQVRAGAHAVAGLNELEYVHGHVFANIYPTDCIAVIDPASGRVRAWLDLHPLAEELRRQAPGAEVSNGIAYDAAANTFYITGKRWPRMFELRILDWPPAAPNQQ